MPFSQRSPRKTRAGLTLIEVIAAIVILGVILTSISIARNRFVRQLSVSDQKRQVIRALDTQISDWIEHSSIPINKHGNLAGVPNCTWRTRTLRSTSGNDMLLQIVRVQVFDHQIHPQMLTDSADNESDVQNDPSIISIDLATHLPAIVEGGGR